MIDPIRLPLNDKWLDWAIDAGGGEEVFVRDLKKQIARRSSGSAARQNQFLDRIGARGLWGTAVHAKTDKIRDRTELLRFLVVLQPDIVIDSAPRPWRKWRGGSRVVVVIGQRLVDIQAVSQQVKQLAIGARDSEAVAELGRLFHGKLGLDCTLDIRHLPPKLDVTQARTELTTLCGDNSVAAVVVLGSPVANRMAIPVAEEVLRPDRSKPPVAPPWLFKWGYQPSNSFLSATPLKPLQVWPPDQQGIVAGTNSNVYLRRISDDAIRTIRRSPKNRQIHFRDCGLLMVDARRHPLLISAQGHGGCGTLGCIQLLSKFGVIDDCFTTSPLGADRIFEAVEVIRSVRGPHEVDDATIESVRVVRQ